ncbi:hypothetical protein DOY81_010482, partial [Sarcophaga bullata]
SKEISINSNSNNFNDGENARIWSTLTPPLPPTLRFYTSPAIFICSELRHDKKFITDLNLDNCRSTSIGGLRMNIQHWNR